MYDVVRRPREGKTVLDARPHGDTEGQNEKIADRLFRTIDNERSPRHLACGK